MTKLPQFTLTAVNLSSKVNKYFAGRSLIIYINVSISRKREQKIICSVRTKSTLILSTNHYLLYEFDSHKCLELLNVAYNNTRSYTHRKFRITSNYIDHKQTLKLKCNVGVRVKISALIHYNLATPSTCPNCEILWGKWAGNQDKVNFRKNESNKT